jgi:hypothetical protein
VLFEQLAHQFHGCSLVASPLHQQIQNLGFVVDRSPEPDPPAGDQNCHLVQMPMTSAAKFLGEQRPELQHPSSDRFIGDVQPALGQQIFDVAEAEGKAKIQPHGVPDDVRREMVASPTSLSWVSWPMEISFARVTKSMGGNDPKIPAYASTVTRDEMGEYERHVKECVDEGFVAFKPHAWGDWREDRNAAEISTSGRATMRR